MRFALRLLYLKNIKENAPAGSGSPVSSTFSAHLPSRFWSLQPGDSGGQDSVLCRSEPRAWRLTWPSRNECVGMARKVQGEDRAPLGKDEVTEELGAGVALVASGRSAVLPRLESIQAGGAADLTRKTEKGA